MKLKIKLDESYKDVEEDVQTLINRSRGQVVIMTTSVAGMVLARAVYHSKKGVWCCKDYSSPNTEEVAFREMARAYDLLVSWHADDMTALMFF